MPTLSVASSTSSDTMAWMLGSRKKAVRSIWLDMSETRTKNNESEDGARLNVGIEY